ncbi:MAG TPA: ATP-binding protein [Candidatus Limnocylindrales bacterium]|nr:ATP-binding protein [Candidatus Limnocylindrales bacterium]
MSRAAGDRVGRRMTPPDEDLRGIRALVDAVPEAVLVMEPNGQVRMTNAAADRLFADRPVQNQTDLLSRFEPTTVDTTEYDPRGDALILRQRHRPNRWFTLRTVDLDDNGAGAAPEGPAASGRSMVFVLRDITDSRDLRPVREAFLGLVSHELRTPITTIYAGSSVLARQPGLSPPATRMLAHDVSAEAARLYDIVEDLLVLARIERGVLDPLDEPVRIDRVVESTIRVATQRHGSVRIRRLGVLGDVVAHGDATYVDQACRNLVLAAIRRPRQPEDADLGIEIRSRREDHEVQVVVSDAGPAVDPADLASAFDLPDVADAPHQPIGGLGLFVARQIIEAMGGRTWAANRPGGGLELGFALRSGAGPVRGEMTGAN